MIFSEEQNREHVKELQRMLYEISLCVSGIPAVIPDGIYGSETREAIKAFQMEYGIPDTGDTDSETWEKLVEINRFYYPEILSPDVFRSGTVLTPHCSGAAVYLVQHMLNTISEKYPNIPAVELTGVYDALTERSVNAFKSVTDDCGCTEGINAALWNSMVNKYNKIAV